MKKRAGKYAGFKALIFAALMAAAAGCMPVHLEHSAVPPQCSAQKIESGGLGSWRDPVKCEMPAGEIEYLERLRGPDGKPVRYMRTGNLGRGVHGNIVDRYVVQSRDGTVCKEVIMDMYYPGYRETRPVEGFSITQPA
jgi:hypothetical protein